MVRAWRIWVAMRPKFATHPDLRRERGGKPFATNGFASPSRAGGQRGAKPFATNVFAST